MSRGNETGANKAGAPHSVLIYLTDPIARELKSFEHDGQTYRFREYVHGMPMASDGAQSWLFVDWLLPEMSGLELCRRLRSEDGAGADLRIVMVLAPDRSEADRERALSTGADDYMLGPLTRNRILDRVMGTAPASAEKGYPPVLSAGKLVIDLLALRASWDNQILNLPMREFRVLQFLAQNPDRVLSRKEILDAVAGSETTIDPRTVDVWILRVRRALEEFGAGRYLRTIRQVGYALDTI